VLAQKSYPYHDRRPDDDDTDGGLLRQVGVHALRYVEHVAGQRIVDVSAVQTGLGKPRARGGLAMAAALTMTLAGGGVAAAVLNYLNPPGFGAWGNETLRIFGTGGFVEAVDGGARTRLVVGSRDRGPLPVTGPGRDYFELFLDELTGVAPMPLTLEEELHPTRMIIRARSTVGSARVPPGPPTAPRGPAG
jgi:predicted dehydrogenase